MAAAARSVSAAAPGYFENAVPLPDEGPVLIELLPRTFEEEAVEVTAEAPELERPAATRVAPDEVLETAGTVDNIFRALATLPGVTPTTDFGSFLSVRGGTPDQNLTLMDGVEIHNPYRLFGLVSAFNPETVSDFSLAAGGFGAQYGDRLSSLLVVRNRPGERAFGGTSSLSITDGNLVFEGPLPGGGSWLATARRTYYDVIVGRVLDQDFPSFEDFQLRADWEFGPGHRLSLVGLSSREDTNFSFTEDEGAEAGERVDFLGDIGNELGAARSRRAALGAGDRHHDPLLVPQHRGAGLRRRGLHREPGGERRGPRAARPAHPHRVRAGAGGARPLAAPGDRHPVRARGISWRPASSSTDWSRRSTRSSRVPGTRARPTRAASRAERRCRTCWSPSIPASAAAPGCRTPTG